jgi:hypothetical protein
MKRLLALLAPVTLLCAAPAARADESLNLCSHQAVREVARLNNELKPVKELYAIATNPTGFALKQVNDHVIHIPKWVHYAMDPQGAIRAKLMDRARAELKKHVGLKNECADELRAPSEAHEVPEPTTLLPLERDI